jgi:hypothetical protein
MLGMSKNVDARIVNNALVVSFMTSDPPRVWRADMSGLASSTLELRETQPGKFHLVLKTSAGREEDISTFNDRMAASDAFRSVTEAMLRGESAIASAAAGPAAAPVVSGQPRGGFFKGVLKLFAWLLGIAAALVLALQIFSTVKPGGMSAWSPGAHMPAGGKTGAPMSADKLFEK